MSPLIPLTVRARISSPASRSSAYRVALRSVSRSCGKRVPVLLWSVPYAPAGGGRGASAACWGGRG